MNIAVEISPLTSINPNTLNLNLNTELATIVSINSICRLCATNSDRFINFYGPEGISNDLPNKINSYLPIKVQVTDELPQQCCLNCASTLLAWHELVLVSVETDRRLRTYQLVNEKTIFNIQFEGAASAEDVLGPQEHQQEQHHVEGLEPSSVIGVSITAADCLNDFCQTQATPANNTTNSIICHDNVENFASNNAALGVVNQEQIELKVEEKLCDVSNSRPVSHAKRRRKDKLEPRCSSPELNPAVLDTFLFANIEKHLIGDGTDDLTKQSTVNADEFKIHIKDSGGMLKLEDDLHCQSNNDMLLGDSLVSCSIPNGVQLNIVQPQHPTITQADDNPHHPHQHHQNNKFLHCLNDSNPDGNEIVLARPENGGGSLDTTMLENNDTGCYLKLEENCDNDDGENDDGNDDYNDDYNDGDDDDEEDDDVEDELAFACYHCTAIFIPRDGVFDHMKREHPDLPAVDPVPQAFACVHCAAIFLLREDVYEHMRKDHGEMPVLDPVPHSISPGRRRHRRNNKGDHKKKKKRQNVKLDQKAANEAKVVVDGKIYYNCKECGKSLHSPYTYSWHTRIHTGERPYVCDLCGKQFRVSQGLVRHLRETHEGIKKFACDLCGRMFATRRNVDEHRRIHTNERPYVCDLCGKSFKQKASLFVHKRSHKNYFPFVCVYCNRGFRTKPPLMVHVTKHTGEKPYKCDTCGRAFRIKYELKRHKLIHSEAKPFACSYCGLCFRQKRYLRNHFKSSHNRTGDEQTPA